MHERFSQLDRIFCVFFLSKGVETNKYRLFTEFPRDRVALLILRGTGDMTDPDRLTDGEREGRWEG